MTQCLGATPEPWQAQALQDIADNDRIAIRSGHGVGKSTLLAWTILWWHTTRFPAKTPCTAPTAHQLEDILWAELAKWHRQMQQPFRDWFECKSDRFELKSAPDESFAVARTARKENPEAFQGFHSDNLLFIADEASGIDEIIFEVGQGAMSTKGAKAILTGNPTKISGYFYDCFHKARERWTRRTVSSENVERARGHIEDISVRYGKDSNAYRVRVLGEFPTAEDETVIGLDLVEAACERQVVASEAFRVVWGLDVARFGDDRTALAKRRGNVLLEPIKFWRQKDTMQVSGLIKSEFEGTWKDERPSEILIDVIGLGAGVVDRLTELGLPVRGINVAEQPAAKERYMRLRDELWFRGREWFQARDCKIPRDEALIAELTAPTYSISSGGKIIVEPKDELKKRGYSSPDLADCFLLTFAGGMDLVEEHERDRYRKKPPRKGSAWAA